MFTHTKQRRANYVFPRPGDWNSHIHQSGYWFVEEPTDYQPSEALIRFLQAGEKPVYIGFGSVFDTDEKDAMSTRVIEALAKSGRRGILCGMGEWRDLPDHVFAVDSIPHSWLFERVSAVCHHGGAGTTVAGFKAGVPSIIVPFANDQFAWAHRAHDLGVGAKPIPVKKLTADNLAEAIRFVHNDHVVASAKMLATHMASENGARDCAKVIVDCLEGKA
ncbi:udp-glucuronosyltransferase family, putative [Heliomicrobium modesticaldum Ice1]|uniref:Udp-glucuronosyltransferase family, putative n=1 Tax=Heliobacterium modesticaldum (strain ATCC 51547 / Ice1) TaxID=498761 RepID=B0THX3_HELMI|nr:nucleotide disphospho-sugar-binding domain-containing protein [Heliomicrobium modesticaldum]ABZ82646.1 udp-glucuronosyltransferase family, putative [Heliomicrobium modesticaldum Ice1]